VFALVWRWSLAKALETPARSTPAKAAKRGLGFFGVFPGTPVGAVAARALTYWMRDPRYAQSLIVLPLVPVFVLLYSRTDGDLTPLNAVGPIIAVLLAMSIYTDVSYDNTAFALHLQMGVSGRDDQIGRVLALAVFAVPLSLLVVLGTVVLSDAWTALPGLLGITIGVLLSGFALSSLVSGGFVFAVPAPGESPFKSKPGGGISLMVSLLATWSILAVLVLPELVVAIIGFTTGPVVFGWISLALGIMLGPCCSSSASASVAGSSIHGALNSTRPPGFAPCRRTPSPDDESAPIVESPSSEVVPTGWTGLEPVTDGRSRD
jgi:ABC-2 type transport system permease protein